MNAPAEPIRETYLRETRSSIWCDERSCWLHVANCLVKCADRESCAPLRAKLDRLRAVGALNDLLEWVEFKRMERQRTIEASRKEKEKMENEKYEANETQEKVLYSTAAAGTVDCAAVVEISKEELQVAENEAKVRAARENVTLIQDRRTLALINAAAAVEAHHRTIEVTDDATLAHAGDALAQAKHIRKQLKEIKRVYMTFPKAVEGVLKSLFDPRAKAMDTAVKYIETQMNRYLDAQEAGQRAAAQEALMAERTIEMEEETAGGKEGGESAAPPMPPAPPTPAYVPVVDKPLVGNVSKTHERPKVEIEILDFEKLVKAAANARVKKVPSNVLTVDMAMLRKVVAAGEIKDDKWADYGVRVRRTRTLVSNYRDSVAEAALADIDPAEVEIPDELAPPPPPSPANTAPLRPQGAGYTPPEAPAQPAPLPPPPAAPSLHREPPKSGDVF